MFSLVGLDRLLHGARLQLRLLKAEDARHDRERERRRGQHLERREPATAAPMPARNTRFPGTTIH